MPTVQHPPGDAREQYFPVWTETFPEDRRVFPHAPAQIPVAHHSNSRLMGRGKTIRKATQMALNDHSRRRSFDF
jgi:hypothetical protein